MAISGRGLPGIAAAETYDARVGEFALGFTLAVGLLGWLAGSSWRHFTRNRSEYKKAVEGKRKAGQARSAALWPAVFWIAALALLVYVAIVTITNGA